MNPLVPTSCIDASADPAEPSQHLGCRGIAAVTQMPRTHTRAESVYLENRSDFAQHYRRLNTALEEPR
jgi:hypothetical protein